jgi:hypothetical protein
VPKSSEKHRKTGKKPRWKKFPKFFSRVLAKVFRIDKLLFIDAWETCPIQDVARLVSGKLTHKKH